MILAEKNDELVLVDNELSARLERTEALACARFVESRARQSALSGATWIEVAGAFAMFDGAESPLTQSFGLGMNGEVTSDDFDKLESFYRERNSPVLFSTFHRSCHITLNPYH